MNELLLMSYHQIGKPQMIARFNTDEIDRIFHTDYAIVVVIKNFAQEYQGDFIISVKPGGTYEDYKANQGNVSKARHTI